MIVSELIRKLGYFNSDARVVVGRNMLKKQLIVLQYKPDKHDDGPGRLYIYDDVEVQRGIKRKRQENNNG